MSLQLRLHLKLILTIAVMLLPALAIMVSSQLDSIQQLNEIEVTAQRINFTNVGKHTEILDSQLMAVKHHENLASLLSSHTPLFVRSYGGGTLATLGIRGGGAAHTQILWNGIPVRNPMLGLVDLALIPTAVIDQASIHYGGHGAAFGSGAVGGLISVDNDKVSLSNAIHVGTSIGSWGNRSGQLQLDYGINKIRFSSRIFGQNGENHFTYRLNKDLPEKHQVHHQLKNNGFLQEIYFPFNDKQYISARIWYQDADRQIPPTSTQTTSKASQQDENLRMTLQWNHQGEKFQWQLKSAWLDETINYQDSLILLYTHNQFKTWLAEGSTSFRISQRLHLTGGVYTEIAKGESANYSDIKERQQTAFFSSIRLTTGNFIWRLQGREELTTGEWSPFLIDISAEWLLIKGFDLKTSFSKNYRSPTLNDLHWRPGGNPELAPEEGWTYEAGLHYRNNNRQVSLTSSATVYTRMINNWIMWMPPVKDVSNFWAPLNIARVKSEGIETRANLVFQKQDFNLSFRFGLDLTWSTFEEPLEEFRINAGDQLFYVPVENLLTGVNLNFGHLTVYYDHHWFSDAPGINDMIEAFNIGNGGLNYHASKGDFSGTIYFQVDNIWDTPYRIIERRPMPGRGYTAGIRFSLK